VGQAIGVAGACELSPEGAGLLGEFDRRIAGVAHGSTDPSR
jgi:hypothetical protein